MIFVIFQADDFKYEILDTVKLFYQEDEIAVAEPENEIAHYCTCLTISKSFINGLHQLCIEFKDRNFSTAATVCMDDDTTELSELGRKKKVKWTVKRLIYDLLSQSTGKKLPWGVLTGIRPSKIVHEQMEAGKDKLSIIDSLTNFYKVSREKAEMLHDISLTEKGILDKTPPDSVGIYIGIPFCPTRCLYCSFTSNPADKCSNLMKPYIDALKHEIRVVGDILKERGDTIQSIYIGGGTPTALPAELLEELIGSVCTGLNIGQAEEFTVEAGRPDSVDGEKLGILKNYGITRISINPQSMNAVTLDLIGRRHTPDDVVKAFKLARQLGFGNINMDVIVGLPGETPGMFEHTLRELAGLSPESLTVHALAIKRASRLNEQRENFELGSAQDACKMIELGHHYAENMGMHPYYMYRQKNILGNLENTGYCKPGCECIYNIQIMEERQTIVALGAGSVTKAYFADDNRVERAFNVKNLEEYISRIDEMLDRKRKLLL